MIIKHKYVHDDSVYFSFLQDSLDLSHDEIHRSLQTNMAVAANRSNGHAVDLNPMEFIEQNGGNGSTGGSGGPPSSANAGSTTPSGVQGRANYYTTQVHGSLMAISHFMV